MSTSIIEDHDEGSSAANADRATIDSTIFSRSHLTDREATEYLYVDRFPFPREKKWSVNIPVFTREPTKGQDKWYYMYQRLLRINDICSLSKEISTRSALQEKPSLQALFKANDCLLATKKYIVEWSQDHLKKEFVVHFKSMNVTWEELTECGNTFKELRSYMKKRYKMALVDDTMQRRCCEEYIRIVENLNRVSSGMEDKFKEDHRLRERKESIFCDEPKKYGTNKHFESKSSGIGQQIAEGRQRLMRFLRNDMKSVLGFRIVFRRDEMALQSVELGKRDGTWRQWHGDPILGKRRCFRYVPSEATDGSSSGETTKGSSSRTAVAAREKLKVQDGVLDALGKAGITNSQLNKILLDAVSRRGKDAFPYSSSLTTVVALEDNISEITGCTVQNHGECRCMYLGFCFVLTDD